MVRISKSKLFGSGSSSSKKPKLPKDESHHKHSHEHKKHLKSADLRSLLKKSKLKKEKESKKESKDKDKEKDKEKELLRELKKRELDKSDDSSSSSLDDLSDMYSDSNSNSNSESSSDSEMESNPFNELNLDQIKPEKSMENNLVNDKLRIDIMSKDYVNICTQIHLLSKTLTCSKQDKAKIATLVYYYIKYFLYSCCIKKKPIFDWLEDFKDKIHIY